MNWGSSEVDEVTEVIVNMEMVKCEYGQLIKVVICGVYSRTAMVCFTRFCDCNCRLHFCDCMHI